MREPAPLGAQLRAPFTDAQVERMWREVSARRRHPRAAVWWALPVAAAALLAVGVTRRRAPLTEPTRALALRDGSPLRAESLRGDGVLELSDGSRVTRAAGAALALRESTPTAVTFALSTGRADFDVTPGGPRRWSVDCGLATVTVVGTAFTLTRSPRALEVSVSHGRVWVDGPLVEGRHRVLTAGQSLAVREPEAPTAPAAVAAAPAPRRIVRPRTIAAPEPEAWRVRAAQGDVRGAWDALGPDGFSQASRSATPDALLALADVARRTRHHDLAAPLLARFVAEHPTHPEAAMAAFTLGRDALSVRRQPSEAARWFERALALRPPRTLDEDLRARLVEARHAAGDLAGACAAARGYEAAFPDGRYAAQVRQRCAAE